MGEENGAVEIVGGTDIVMEGSACIGAGDIAESGAATEETEGTETAEGSACGPDPVKTPEPEAAGKPGTASPEAGQVAVLEAENEELKKSFAPLYTEIGRNFYEKPAGYELAITAAVEKLNKINDRIHDNYLAVLRLKGIHYCPNCENIVDDETVFCGDCGTRIDPVEEADDHTVLCGCCGALNDKNNHFCIKCGQGLEMQRPVSRRCPSCGIQLPADARFCEECGTRLI